MTVSDEDFELAGAYHDGELGPDAVAAFRRRLDAEPALRAALRDIAEMSSALGGLRPAPAASAPSHAGPPISGRKDLWPRVAMAASVAGLAMLGGLLFRAAFPPQLSPLDWHQSFSTQSYSFAAADIPVPASRWIGQEPDLSLAGLRLVDAGGDAKTEVYLHYAGVNDCRLTFGTHVEAPQVPPAGADLLTHVWSTGRMHYSLIALGMDRHRFAAIAAMLEERTRVDDLPEATLLAVQEATRTATPCA